MTVSARTTQIGTIDFNDGYEHLIPMDVYDVTSGKETIGNFVIASSKLYLLLVNNDTSVSTGDSVIINGHGIC